MHDTADLIGMTATQVVDLLNRGDITGLDLLDALEARIVDVEPRVNALSTLCFERARAHARRLLALPAGERGVLGGLPVPIKDLTKVAGVRTTFGSKVHENHIPDTSDLLVETLEAAGAVIYAKSNTPEFGAGGNTFNDVFGPTRNPHDLTRSAGGSSGGAAAALASGAAWLAHGSDLAGSLRTPAGFCGVASLRPSPGLIASGPKKLPFDVLAQHGAMARSVEDVALMSDALAGGSAFSGLSKPAPATSFRSAAQQPQRPHRVAFSADLGVTTTDPDVLVVCEAAMREIEKAGVGVAADHPDLSGVHEAFGVLRAVHFAVDLGGDLARARALIKPEVVWNVEQGLALDGATIRDALAVQGRLFGTAAQFMADYDVLICPAAIVEPFPIEERYPGHGAGVPVSDYYKWLAIAYAITMTSLPVITLPCGTTTDGLPVGIQLVGRPHGEAGLFSYARFIEQVLGLDPAPIEPKGR